MLSNAKLYEAGYKCCYPTRKDARFALELGQMVKPASVLIVTVHCQGTFDKYDKCYSQIIYCNVSRFKIVSYLREL